MAGGKPADREEMKGKDVSFACQSGFQITIA